MENLPKKIPETQSLANIAEPEQIKSVTERLMEESIMDIIRVQKYLPTISSLNRAEPGAYRAYMAHFTVLLNEAFNLPAGAALNEAQMDMIILGTHTQFPYFRLNDVFQIVKGFMTGKYKVYNRLDPPMWYEACRKYDVERGTLQADYLEVQHHNNQFHPIEPYKWVDENGVERSSLLILKTVDKKKPKQPDWAKRLQEHTLVVNELVNKLGYAGTYRELMVEFGDLRKRCITLRDNKRQEGRVYRGIRTFAIWLDGILKEVDKNVQWK